LSFHHPLPLPPPPSFPTRRSSDLASQRPYRNAGRREVRLEPAQVILLGNARAENDKAVSATVGDGEIADQPAVVVEHGRQAEPRSEEHTSELQSRGHLVCRLLLEK